MRVAEEGGFADCKGNSSSQTGGVGPGCCGGHWEKKKLLSQTEFVLMRKMMMVKTCYCCQASVRNTEGQSTDVDC